MKSNKMQAISYSQWGEDVMVLDFFGNQVTGTFFEAGAHHPTLISQTYLLERHGWHGVLVEALPDKTEEFVRLRPRSKLFARALGDPKHKGDTMDFVIPADGNTAEARLLSPHESPPTGSTLLKVEMTTISDVLTESGLTELDFLSLDVEGDELAAFRGLDFSRWKPRLILVEDHLFDLRLHRFLKTKGYRLVLRTGSNNWYVPQGTEFPARNWRMRLELIRKLYLSMPFRKLRQLGKRIRGRAP